MIKERRFILDVKIGADTQIDFDCSPDTEQDEFNLIVSKLKELDFKKFKFKIVNEHYAIDIATYIKDFISKFGTIEKIEFIQALELMIAFTVKFNHKN